MNIYIYIYYVSQTPRAFLALAANGICLYVTDCKEDFDFRKLQRYSAVQWRSKQ
jgi:hypothetical protein